MAPKSRVTVDTHVFQELGTLLVGRESTALIELIKNAYDADATEVHVYGHAIEDAGGGYISIRDNGAGMTLKAFETGFLRIASRSKETTDRRSAHFKRRFTGAKGVGRLAAHRLAALLEITSVAKGTGGKQQQVRARIDWNAIEKKETLDQLGDEEVLVETPPLPTEGAPRGTGTQLVLRRLRQAWTTRAVERFLEQVRSFEPPALMTHALHEIGAKLHLLEAPLLFGTPQVRDSLEGGTFQVFLEGDFEREQPYWEQLAEAVEWVIEVDASAAERKVTFGVAPTRNYQKRNPLVEPRQYEAPHPDPDHGPTFQARILVRKGNWTHSDKAKEWANSAAGIRVFMEGFRVLPYGEPKDDWLSINEEYTQRDRNLKLKGGELLSAEELVWEKRQGLGLKVLANDAYFGAVFLTEVGAPSLKMLVNREGFLPDPVFDSVVELVRTAIHLFIRVRAEARESDGPKKPPPPPGPGSPPPLRTVGPRSPRGAPPSPSPAPQAPPPSPSPWAVRSPEPPVTLRLALVGNQMGFLMQESRPLLKSVWPVEGILSRLAGGKALDKKLQQALPSLQSSFEGLWQRMERISDYLEEVLYATGARRKLTRQGLAERVTRTEQVLQPMAELRSISIEKKIAANIQTAPMHPADLLCVLVSVLGHALEHAGEGGKVRTAGQRMDDGTLRLLVEHTGDVVDLQDSDRWFRSSESAQGGTGARSGFFLARGVLEPYGASLRFVPPGSGFATAVELRFLK